MSSKNCTHEVNRRKNLLRLNEIDNVCTALDVGTGGGFTALALASDSEYVIAVDKDWTHLVQYAHPRICENIILVQADFMCLPIHSVDLYCSFGSWQHALMHQSSLKNLEKTIKEAYKSLNSDGTLLLVERLAFFDDWQPKNQFQKHQRVYYSVIERVFQPPIFGKALVSPEEFLSLIELYFTIVTSEVVYDRDKLSDAFFTNIRKKNLTMEDERSIRYLAENRKAEEPMMRVVAKKS